jgi:tRNA 2-thiocytidine biosynthesis protein TtcA
MRNSDLCYTLEIMDIEKKILKKLYWYQKKILFSKNENYLFAFSGGVDSLVLLRLLRKILLPQKVKIVHIYPVELHSDFLKLKEKFIEWGYNDFYLEKHSAWNENCYLCARYRRRQIFELAEKLQVKNIILGHTGTDLIETYLMNLCLHSRGESLPFVQSFFSDYFVYRPLIGVLKEDILKYSSIYYLKPFHYPCKGEKTNKRQIVRDFLGKMGIDSQKNLLRFVLQIMEEKFKKIP